MTSRLTYLLGTFLLLCYGCSTKTTVQVERHPLIQFTYDSLIWQDNSYQFLQPYKIVAYPADSTLPGKYYMRLGFQAYGQDTKGNNLQLNISFDASDASHLVGVYKPAYSENYGLAGAELYNLNANKLSEYTLCAGDTNSFLQIQRQSPSESLIAGSFQLMLCNTRDTTKKIMITQGSITDINY